MTRNQRLTYAAAAAVLMVALIAFFVVRHRAGTGGVASVSQGPASSTAIATGPEKPGEATPAIKVYAHNILLRKGADFKVYIRWIRGVMQPTRAGRNPSFDDPNSFVLEIERGMLFAKIDDVAAYLDHDLPADSPLKHVTIAPKDDGQLQLKGTVHKVIPLPVSVVGQLSATPDYRIRFHVTKINVLKIPMKGLLGAVHIQLDDLTKVKDIPGVQIVGNDVFFDTQKLLPAPHIHGAITQARVVPPNIEIVYGASAVDGDKLAQWHNFLRLKEGTLDFGKLTMRDVDLTMIDATKSQWFDLDLVNYQAQLVNGYTRVTPAAGLEIFMPAPGGAVKKTQDNISLQWLKDRKTAMPADVPKETQR